MDDSFLNAVFHEAGKKTKKRFWLISDLQQGNPANAERYFSAAVSDLKSLDPALDGVCYLGDAAEGIDLQKLKTMTDMQLSLLDSLNVPVYYSMGNHELDYYNYCRREGLPPSIPFYETVRQKKNWHLIADQEDFYFSVEMEDFIMLFFSDHASKDGSWVATHQFLPPETEPYPHTKEKWQAVRDEFAKTQKPVFTFSHCAYPGGNRPSQFLEQLLPLPENFRAHFYGHAHIGDHYWAGEHLYRQIACVEHQQQLQFDISSLDHLRGTTVRSAIFDYYGNGEYAVFFRDHLNHRWENCCIQPHDAKSAGLPENQQHYNK